MRLVPVLVVVLSLFAAGPAHAQGFDGWIIGGTQAPAGSYPWQVALVQDGATPSNGQFCGGTLIAPNKVATAAHCVLDGTTVTPAAAIDVFANQTNLSAAGDRLDVTEVSLAPGASVPDTGEVPHNDAAILTLQGDVPRARSLDVIAAQGSSAQEDAIWAPGDPVVVTGWGATGYRQDGTPIFPNPLQEVELTRFSDSSCLTAWGSANFSATDMLCAGVTSAPVRDSCNGDSGGGLIARSTSRSYRWTSSPWRLVGIVSWGADPCTAGQPGVYTRAASPTIRTFLSSTPPAAPTPAGAPPFSGSPVVGGTVHCDSPGWGAAALSEQRFEIYRVPTSGSPVRVAADTQDYTVTANDLNTRLVCLVSARSCGGQAVAESAALGPVTNGSATSTGATSSDASISTTAVCGATPGTTDPGTTTDPGAQPGDATRPGEAVVARPQPAPVAPTPTAGVLPDVAPPRASVLGRRICRLRRCTLTVLATDPKPSSGIASVKGRIRYRARSTCRRSGRRVRCLRTVTRTITARRVSGGTFRLRTPLLPKGRHTLRLTATDRAGNPQRLPSIVRLTIR